MEMTTHKSIRLNCLFVRCSLKPSRFKESQPVSLSMKSEKKSVRSINLRGIVAVKYALVFLIDDLFSFMTSIDCVYVPRKEGVVDPPSVSSISRLLRGGIGDRKDDRKDYSIHGILGGKSI
jgi:hypothetical protein